MSLRDLFMTVRRTHQSFFIPPRILHSCKDRRADCEIYQQAPVFLEERVTLDRGQMWHEQEIECIACENGYKRV